MFRQIALIAALIATPCAAQTMPAPETELEDASPRSGAIRPGDPFVIAGDECGASRYQHLIGEQFAEAIQASLPSDTYVLGMSRMTTLEYKPGRINVTLGGGGQIIAIGCF